MARKTTDDFDLIALADVLNRDPSFDVLGICVDVVDPNMVSFTSGEELRLKAWDRDGNQLAGYRTNASYLPDVYDKVLNGEHLKDIFALDSPVGEAARMYLMPGNIPAITVTDDMEAEGRGAYKILAARLENVPVPVWEYLTSDWDIGEDFQHEIESTARVAKMKEREPRQVFYPCSPRPARQLPDIWADEPTEPDGPDFGF